MPNAENAARPHNGLTMVGQEGITTAPKALIDQIDALGRTKSIKSVT